MFLLTQRRIKVLYIFLMWLMRESDMSHLYNQLVCLPSFSFATKSAGNKFCWPAKSVATTVFVFLVLISIQALRNLVWLNSQHTVVTQSVILPTFQDILPRKQIRSKSCIVRTTTTNIGIWPDSGGGHLQVYDSVGEVQIIFNTWGVEGSQHVLWNVPLRRHGIS